MPGLGETDLRLEIEALDRKRIDAAEARIWLYRGLPLRLLAEVGHAWLAWLFVAVIVGDVVLTVALGSWVAAVAGLVFVVVLSAYASNGIEAWVAAHNARIDDRIRALLAAGRADP